MTALAQAYRAAGLTVGIVAIDPTSPFTGGAILGDRIRMQAYDNDPGVFIRSCATRGAMGGLSQSTSNVVRVLDAFGKDVIIIETVGVGQDEVEIVSTAARALTARGASRDARRTSRPGTAQRSPPRARCPPGRCAGCGS